MIALVIDNLTTVDAKNKAIEMLKNEVIDFKDEMVIKKSQNIASFELKEKYNLLVKYIICLYFNIENIDGGIKYFHKNYI